MKWMKPQAQPTHMRANQLTSEGEFSKQRVCKCGGRTFLVFLGQRPQLKRRRGILLECIECHSTQWILAEGTVRGRLKQ